MRRRRILRSDPGAEDEEGPGLFPAPCRTLRLLALLRFHLEVALLAGRFGGPHGFDRVQALRDRSLERSVDFRALPRRVRLLDGDAARLGVDRPLDLHLVVARRVEVASREA